MAIVIKDEGNCRKHAAQFNILLRRADCIEKLGYFGNIPTNDFGEPVINPITCQKVPMTEDSWSFQVRENDDYVFHDTAGKEQVSQCYETANALGTLARELSQKFGKRLDSIQTGHLSRRSKTFEVRN